MDETAKTILTVSGLLFGFFFTAFWWILNRELRFDEDQRHFKIATGVLMASMALLAVFGIIVPLRAAARTNAAVVLSYRGVLLALVTIYGYMLIELGHYRVYQWPKYVRKSEWFFLGLTVAVVAALVIRWWVL